MRSLVLSLTVSLGAAVIGGASYAGALGATVSAQRPRCHRSSRRVTQQSC
jgi:hypothetical protein